MIDWNIQSRAQACQACGKPFLDKQPFHTLLFDLKTGYERLDVCEPCWAAQYSQGATSRNETGNECLSTNKPTPAIFSPSPTPTCGSTSSTKCSATWPNCSSTASI